MAINFDVNKGLENPKSSGFLKRLMAFIVIALMVIIYYAFMSNKHTKLPGGTETNIPENKTTQISADTPAIKKNDTTSVKVETLQVHTGTGDNIGGNKTTINK
jgi:ATP-dependent Zn protease